MFSSRSGGQTSWSVEYSTDLGGSFAETTGGPAPRDMNVGAYWGDSSNIHTVSRFGIVQHSGDAGGTFNLEQDSSDLFRAFIGYVDAGADTGSIYIVGPGNSAARFWMYWNRPSSVHETGDRQGSGLTVSLRGNPVFDGMVRFAVDPALRLQGVTLYDGLGRAVLTHNPDPASDGAVDLDASHLPAGRYTLEVRTHRGSGTAPIVIVR